MTNLQEVPTDELLLFQNFATIENTSTIPNTHDAVNISIDDNLDHYNKGGAGDAGINDNSPEPGGAPVRSFWTLEYYQRFFNVDTQDVLDRILASVIPKRGSLLKQQLRHNPDLYGPFWISITLVFTIAISGNISNYLQSANNTDFHWKYDFHLVSYAATTICLYVTLVPFAIWGLLKWSTDSIDTDGLEETSIPGVLELICIYGYSLFIYIPVSVLWSIQVNLLQWMLVLIAAVLSGSVLLSSLLPALRLSKHKIIIGISVASLHVLLAAGFLVYFFHVPSNTTHLIIQAPTLGPLPQHAINKTLLHT